MYRTWLALLLVGAVFSACGDDDDEAERPAETTPPATAPAPVTTPPPETTPTEQEKKDPDAEPRTVPPEEQQGDEEPIRSEAVFTGTGGRLTPKKVRVPAFIAIRVILRSSDSSSYSLAIGGSRMAIGDGRRTDELELDGLLPEESYEGRSQQGNVRIVASAEPGP